MLRQAGGPLAFFFTVSLATTAVYEFGYRFRIFALPDLPLSLIGSALGIFLGFRTNSAYGRWWEARTLWGAIINQSRTWARQVLSFSDSEHEGWRQQMVYAQIAYAYALASHLREEEALATIQPFLPEDWRETLQGRLNIPAALVHQMGIEVARAADRKWISEIRLLAFNQTLTELTNAQGGCERIRNTPLPRQYDYYPEIFVYGYCVLLPLAIVPEIGYATPVVTLLISFALIVLNRIGKNLEDPFHSLVYGIPMSALSRNIEIELRQRLGETELPPAIRSADGVLI